MIVFFFEITVDDCQLLHYMDHGTRKNVTIEEQTGCVCRVASDDEPSALNPADVRLLVHRRSVSRAGLEQEEDGEADDEPRHDQRQRRRRRRHAEVLRHQVGR